MASHAGAGAEAFLLLTMALLLSLRLLSHALRPRASPARRSRSSACLLVATALLTAIYAVPEVGTRPSTAIRAKADAYALRSEIEALRFKVARLESMLEENTKTLNIKTRIIEEDSKLIRAMEHNIQLLTKGPDSTKNSQTKSYSAADIKSMEDEVQQLQQEISKINSNSYTIELFTRETEKRVETLSSEAQKIEGIIAEQWVQIRQFEQAFVLTKMMTSKVHGRSRPSEMAYKWLRKETILKYVRNIDLSGNFLRGTLFAKCYISHTYKQSRSFVQAIKRCYHEASRFRKAIGCQYIPDNDRPNVFFLGGSISSSCSSLLYNQFKICMLLVQKFHHKVQLSIQEAMNSNRYSRDLANELVTFFLAYLIVISPMWISWFLVSMRFGSRK